MTVRSLTGGLQGDTGIHMIIGAGGNGAGGNLASIWDDSGYQWIGNGGFDNTATIEWSYNPARLQSVVDGGLTWWQITLAKNGGSPATFAIDNVQLIPVPEPTALAVLGLAAAALMRRRHA